MYMRAAIRFGTSGWRAVVAGQFTLASIRLAIAGIAEYVKSQPEPHRVLVGRDPRFLGEWFVTEAARVLAGSGGEESAGVTIRGHVPEKDGIIAGLLVTEMVATRGKSLGVQLRELFAKVGSYYPVRENFRLTPEVKAAFTEKLKADPVSLSGRKVTKVVRTDGLKLILDDGSWVCYRLSGTEPVVRAYTEARSEKELESMRVAARKFVTG